MSKALFSLINFFGLTEFMHAALHLKSDRKCSSADSSLKTSWRDST